MNKILSAGLIVLITFFVCCKAEDTKEEVIDGIRTVHNYLSKKKPAGPFVIEEDLVIAESEEDEAFIFSRPVDIDADSNGNIYVLDRQAFAVKIFDPQGGYIRSIGKQGQGPGEFEYPSDLIVNSEGGIIINDPYRYQINFIDSSGEFSRSIRTHYYLTNLSIIPENGIILSDHSEIENDIMQYHLTSWDSSGAKLNDIYTRRIYSPARFSNDALTYDLPYLVCWAVDSGNRIYIGTGTRYEIGVYSLEGKLQFRFDLDRQPVPLGGDALGAIKDMLKPSRGPNPYLQNPVFPLFSQIAIDEKDRIWIKHYRTRWKNKIFEESTYDVFSQEGQILCTVTIPAHISSRLKFKNGRLYTLRLEPDGYTSAVRYKIK